MGTLCDGSRRPARGQRHKVKHSASGHATGICPVCKQKLRLKRVLGMLEFPRHTAKK